MRNTSPSDVKRTSSRSFRSRDGQVPAAAPRATSGPRLAVTVMLTLNRQVVARNPFPLACVTAQPGPADYGNSPSPPL
jgi:hypothetical protein